MVPFGLGRNVQPAILIKPQIIDESCMQEMYSIFLQQHDLILISSDVPARARVSAVLERIFSRPFSEKLSELLFQNFDSL